MTASVDRVLAGLRDELVPLVAAIDQSGREPDVRSCCAQLSRRPAGTFGREVAIGDRLRFQPRPARRHHPSVLLRPLGRTIAASRPATTNTSSVRRFFGIMHEAGHGIYDQGLRADQFGCRWARPSRWASTSRSRECGRTWSAAATPSGGIYFARAQERFPESLGDVRLDDFYFAINDVRPSLVRVEADEATYNLHILIRFELEQALLGGDWRSPTCPGAWNEKYREYLGIVPPNDALGVLQDVHWSGGAIGYFPTYSLGNLYAAQIFAQAETEVGPLDEQFARGEFQPLREWLGEKIHRQGQRYPGRHARPADHRQATRLRGR